MKLYTCSAIDELVDKYIERGGFVAEVIEGTLGWGTTLMYGEGLKTCVVQEVYLNEWSSAHKVRFYNTMPKKYERMLEEWESHGEDE